MDGTHWRVAPYFIVDDVIATANFYREKLGFDYDQFWGAPASFCMVWRNGVVIMLKQLEKSGLMQPNHWADPKNAPWDAYIWVDNAVVLRDELKARGVKIIREIEDQDYGCRDFDVEDCNGYRLCFGQELDE